MRSRDPKQEDIAITRAALAMCENIDWNVGRVLTKLDELKLADNTIVLYFSDNGPNSWRWNGGMKGRKGSTDEGGVRSPLLDPLARARSSRAPRSRRSPARSTCCRRWPTWPGSRSPATKPLDGNQPRAAAAGQTAQTGPTA